MPRATNNVASRRRRKRILRSAQGYWGGRHRLYRSAQETVNRALRYAYRDRRAKKQVFRSLWMVRINAAAREHGWGYAQLIHQLRENHVDLNRKMLAFLAAKDSEAFAAVIRALEP